MNIAELFKKNFILVPVIASVLVGTRLSAAEATWTMAENLYEVLADKVREHDYDIKDLNR